VRARRLPAEACGREAADPYLKPERNKGLAVATLDADAQAVLDVLTSYGRPGIETLPLAASGTGSGR
jgi:hypothetical protein